MSHLTSVRPPRQTPQAWHGCGSRQLWVCGNCPPLNNLKCFSEGLCLLPRSECITFAFLFSGEPKAKTVFVGWPSTRSEIVPLPARRLATDSPSQPYLRAMSVVGLRHLDSQEVEVDVRYASGRCGGGTQYDRRHKRHDKFGCFSSCEMTNATEDSIIELSPNQPVHEVLESVEEIWREKHDGSNLRSIQPEAWLFHPRLRFDRIQVVQINGFMFFYAPQMAPTL